MMINDQLILEEDYDENYLPPEDGELFFSLSIEPRQEKTCLQAF